MFRDEGLSFFVIILMNWNSVIQVARRVRALRLSIQVIERLLMTQSRDQLICEAGHCMRGAACVSSMG